MPRPFSDVGYDVLYKLPIEVTALVEASRNLAEARDHIAQALGAVARCAPALTQADVETPVSPSDLSVVFQQLAEMEGELNRLQRTLVPHSTPIVGQAVEKHKDDEARKAAKEAADAAADAESETQIEAAVEPPFDEPTSEPPTLTVIESPAPPRPDRPA